MQVSVEVRTVGEHGSQPRHFAWTVLTALADEVDARWPTPTTAWRSCCSKRRGAARPDGRPREETRAMAAERTAARVPDRARGAHAVRASWPELAPDDDAERQRIRDELVELHLPLVEYLARRFRNRGEWLDDLTQVATIGLIKSIDRFDLERGVEFSTYATPTIVGEIKRHFRDKGWAVRVPRRLQELKLSLTKAISELAQREGRAPTVAELAAHLQMTEEEVLEGLESANAYSTVSLDAPDSGDEDAPAVADSLGMSTTRSRAWSTASRSSRCWSSSRRARSASCCCGSSAT